ncbi:MAG: hypothetical protein QOD11_183 [Bradyrhizobium sp.]|jgi:hypothetical protein|nr:hypothetical protein [Bradyrhizobium sp.]
MLEQYHAAPATGTGQAPACTKTARRAGSFPLILGIEEPLTDAINYVQAMYLMGYGLISHHEAGGDAIAALAEETGQRLEAVKEIWNEMLGEKRRCRNLRRRRAS